MGRKSLSWWVVCELYYICMIVGQNLLIMRCQRCEGKIYVGGFFVNYIIYVRCMIVIKRMAIAGFCHRLYFFWLNHYPLMPCISPSTS